MALSPVELVSAVSCICALFYFVEGDAGNSSSRVVASAISCRVVAVKIIMRVVGDLAGVIVCGFFYKVTWMFTVCFIGPRVYAGGFIDWFVVSSVGVYSGRVTFSSRVGYLPVGALHFCCAVVLGSVGLFVCTTHQQRQLFRQGFDFEGFNVHRRFRLLSGTLQGFVRNDFV